MSEGIDAVEFRLEQWLHPVTPDRQFEEHLPGSLRGLS